MIIVQIYFKVEESRQGKKVKRRIFIATDDPSVFKEAKEKLVHSFCIL